MNIPSLDDWPTENWESPERTSLIINCMKSLDFLGKQVLDLGSHYGIFSYIALCLGASHVYGIDCDAPKTIASSKILARKGVPENQYKFVAGDYLKCPVPLVDIVLALAVIYHTDRHLELLQKIKAVDPRVVIVETMVSPSVNNSGIFKSFSEHGDVLYIPTSKTFRQLFQDAGFTSCKSNSSTEGRVIYVLG